MRRDQPALLRLIELAYAAAEDPSGWAPFLLALADSMASREAVLLHHDLRAGGSIVHGCRTNPEANRLYNEHYHQSDPWALSPKAALLRSGRAITGECLAPYAEVRRTPYFNDFSLKFGISRLLSVSVGHGQDAYSGLSVLRAHEDEPFADGELRWLEAIAPHVTRSAQIGHVLSHAHRERARLAEALDAVTTAIFLVDASARIAHANRAGDAILAARDGLFDSGAGLQAVSAQVTAQLRQLCRRCGDTTHGDGVDPGGAVSVPRRSGRRNLQVVVSPVVGVADPADRDDRIAAIVFVSDPDRSSMPTPAVLQALFGLTPAEATVAAHLAAGKSPEEICSLLRYTRETMRWYSKQLLGKLGCRTRSELLKLLSLTVVTGDSTEMRRVSTTRRS